MLLITVILCWLKDSVFVRGKAGFTAHARTHNMATVALNTQGNLSWRTVYVMEILGQVPSVPRCNVPGRRIHTGRTLYAANIFLVIFLFILIFKVDSIQVFLGNMLSWVNYISCKLRRGRRVIQKMWRVEQENDVIGIFYYARGWQREGTAESTSGERSYGQGWLFRPGTRLSGVRQAEGL